MRRGLLGCGSCLLLAVLSPALLVCMVAPFNGRTEAETDFSGSRLLADPPPPIAETVTLKVVTYNIANARGFTTNRVERIRGVAQKLKELDPDIVGLQEAFVKKDRELLYAELADSRLQYHVRYPCATVGNGLLTLSAYPIEESYFHRYADNNPWYRFWEGDWWAGKGVGLARVRLPGGACVDFYNTHAQAGRRRPTLYLEVRIKQMAALAEFMNATRTGSGPAIVLGDFNTLTEREDMLTAIRGADLVRTMTIDSLIDHIFVARNPRYRFEAEETLSISGTVLGAHKGIFLGRAPTPREIYAMFYGKPGETALSDHSGYLTRLRITPVPEQEGVTQPAAEGSD